MHENSILILSKKDLITYNITFKCGFVEILERDYYPKFDNDLYHGVEFDEQLINALKSACIKYGDSYCYYEKEMGLKHVKRWDSTGFKENILTIAAKDIYSLRFESYQSINEDNIIGILQLFDINNNVIYEIKNIKKTEANAIVVFWKEYKLYREFK